MGLLEQRESVSEACNVTTRSADIERGEQMRGAAKARDPYRHWHVSE